MDEKSAAADPGSMEAISGTRSRISYPQGGIFLEGGIAYESTCEKK